MSNSTVTINCKGVSIIALMHHCLFFPRHDNITGLKSGCYLLGPNPIYKAIKTCNTLRAPSVKAV